MEVACPECGTRFSLDESRIPGSTAKVRCSRCQYVFRITREGQVLSPDWTPPPETPPEAPPPKEVREEIPKPPPPEPAEPFPPPPAREKVPEAAAPAQPAATEAEFPAPAPERKRHWLWLPVLLLALAVLAGLGWLAWQGKLPGQTRPLSDVVQQLKGKWEKAKPAAPPAAVSPEAGAKPVAPTKVTPPSPPVTAQDLRDLPVDWAQAHYQGLVNDKGGGQLLVIQGEVLNKGKTARGPIHLKATLTDSQHRPLREEVVYAGSTFTDNELKTLSPDEIKGWLAKPGGRAQERVVKPGAKIPFTVVFFGVPNNLAETQSGFQIMVVEGPVAAD
jgi:predicted Zn finger-like uncharacterized protein